MMLPPYDTRETLAALGGVVARLRPRTVIALGDSFHDIDGPDRLGDAERATLTQVRPGRDWIWVTGNHDRALPESVGGEVVAEVTSGFPRAPPRAPGGHGGGGRGPSPSGRQGGDARARACAAAASSPTAPGASCRPSAPMRAASTPATPPSSRSSRTASRLISSGRSASSPSAGPCSAGTERFPTLGIEPSQSRRKMTLARYPKKRARMAVAAP